MMELVTEGRLHGDNPSEQDSDPLERLAAESEPQTLNDELAASETEVESEAGDEPKPVDERDEPEPDPGAPKSQVREYVVLEEHTFEDDELYYTVLGKFQARNATNALRRAFKTLITDNEPHKLIAVTGTQWRITPVQRSHRQVESVQIG